MPKRRREKDTMKKHLVLVLILAACCGCPHSALAVTNSANSILVLAPYKYAGTWVFDDRDRGLTKEPFVAGIPAMMDNLTTNIPHADQGFRLLFSAAPFPGYQARLTWRRATFISKRKRYNAAAAPICRQRMWLRLW